MPSELYKKQNYLLNVPYINSTYITEYDLSKANISALKFAGYLSDEDYQFLYHVDKHYREVYIGNLEREDSTVTELKKNGIEEARRLLFFENNLEDQDILAINNDAVFVLGNKVTKSNFGIFDFKKKNVYTFYMTTTNHLSIYYLYDNITGAEVFDVKGINDIKLESHRDYMVSFLCQIFYLLQTNTIEYTIQQYNDFYHQFINFQLDPGYYREFNSSCLYKIYRPKGREFATFGLPYIDKKMLKPVNGRSMIDIQTNILLLRDLYAVLSDIYFNKKR